MNNAYFRTKFYYLEVNYAQALVSYMGHLSLLIQYTCDVVHIQVRRDAPCMKQWNFSICGPMYGTSVKLDVIRFNFTVQINIK